LGGSCLAERLSHHIALTASEQTALDRLEDQQRHLRRGSVIVSEGQVSRELYVVQKGWLQSSVLLGNGGRQIMRIALPGDLLGLSALAFDEAPKTVTALTDVTLCPFDRERLACLFTDHPRLMALLFSLAVAERTALADRLASVGRTSARARVAALLCDIFSRMRVVDPDAELIHVPLTQEEIGDGTGLTAVHVNRMIRGLVEEGIIERSGNAMRLLDSKRLADEANFISRSQICTGWLPPPR
jgi:CRP/FNR family transcriptional regulator, anaerobic regulatory protein